MAVWPTTMATSKRCHQNHILMYRFMVIGYTLPLTTVQARAIGVVVLVAVGASGKDLLTVMDLNNYKFRVYTRSL